MAEIAGDDATYVDPLDVDVDPRRDRARRLAPAPRRVADWADVAAATRAVYEEVA